MPSIADLLVTVGADTGEAENALGGFSDALQSIGLAAGAVGAAMTAGITIPLGGIAGAAITTAAGFQATMSELGAVTGATGEQMAALSSLAQALGADITLPGTSASDAALAMVELSKAGLSVADTMSAAKGVLQLSAAAQVDNATAAQITANALNSFHLAGTDAVRVADLLAGGANASSASMTDLSQGLQQAGFAMAATGNTIDDTVTAIAALTNVGLTGSDAGTALKNAMIKLIDPTKEATAVMKQYGINVFDANGVMLPLPKIIDILNNALGNLTPQQRNAALSTIFLSDGMKAMLPLLDLGSTGFADLKDQVTKQGSASDLAAVKMSGLAGAVEGLKSAAETFLNQIGTPFLSIFEALVRGTTDLLGAFASLPGPILAVVGAIAATAAAIGPALVVIGGLTFVLGGVVGAIGTLVGAFAGVIGFIGTAITAIGGLAVTLGGAIGTFAVAAASLGTVGAAVAAVAASAPGLGLALGALAGVALPVLGAIAAAAATMLASFAVLGTAVGALALAFATDFLGIRTTVGNVIAAFGDFLGVLGSLGNYFGAVIEDGDTLNDWLTHLPEALQGPAQAFATFGVNVGDAIRGIIQLLSGSAFDAQSFATAITNLFGADNGSRVLGIIGQLALGFQDFRAVMSDVGTAITAIAPALLDFNFQPLIAALQALGLPDDLNQSILEFVNNLHSLGPAALEVAGSLAGALADAFREILPVAIGFGEWLVSSGIPALLNFGEVAIPIVIAAIQLAVREIKGLALIFGTVLELIGSLTQFIVDLGTALVGVSQPFVDLGIAISEGVAAGLNGLAGAIIDAIAGAIRAALAALKSWLGIASPSTMFEQELGIPIGEGIVVGVMSALAGLVGGVKAILDQVAGLATDVLGGFGAAIGGAIGGAAAAVFGPIANMIATPINAQIASWGAALRTAIETQTSDITSNFNANTGTVNGYLSDILGALKPGPGTNGGTGVGGNTINIYADDETFVEKVIAVLASIGLSRATA